MQDTQDKLKYQEIAFTLQRLNAAFEDMFPYPTRIRAIGIEKFIQSHVWSDAKQRIAFLSKKFAENSNIQSIIDIHRIWTEFVSLIHRMEINNDKKRRSELDDAVATLVLGLSFIWKLMSSQEGCFYDWDSRFVRIEATETIISRYPFGFTADCDLFSDQLIRRMRTSLT